jgi:ferredoxin--NADP+ reductase
MKTYQVLEITHLTSSVCKIRTERPEVTIQAGQCFNIGVPGGSVNREYSMYSPANAPYLEFLIKVVEGGCVSPLLKLLKVGDFLEIDGPYGQFYLREPQDLSLQYLFLGTGTGIAPFRSFVMTYPDINYQIIHGIRNPEEQYDRSDYLGDRYIPCISQNKEGMLSQRITDYLLKNSIGTSSIVYLCGNRNMIVDAFEILRNQQISGDNIFTEVFF